MKVKTNIKAGGWSNRCEKFVAQMKVKTSVKAGGQWWNRCETFLLGRTAVKR